MGIVQELEERRNAILEEMRSIRSMRRGTINEQYFTVPVKGTEKTKLQGPYYVLSRREGEGTVSQRLRSSELEQAKRDIAAHKKFVLLCREFEQLTTRLTALEREEPRGSRKKNDADRLRTGAGSNPDSRKDTSSPEAGPGGMGGSLAGGSSVAGREASGGVAQGDRMRPKAGTGGLRVWYADGKPGSQDEGAVDHAWACTLWPLDVPVPGLQRDAVSR